MPKVPSSVKHHDNQMIPQLEHGSAFYSYLQQCSLLEKKHLFLDCSHHPLAQPPRLQPVHLHTFLVGRLVGKRVGIGVGRKEASPLVNSATETSKYDSVGIKTVLFSSYVKPSPFGVEMEIVAPIKAAKLLSTSSSPIIGWMRILSTFFAG